MIILLIALHNAHTVLDEELEEAMKGEGKEKWMNRIGKRGKKREGKRKRGEEMERGRKGETS